jgi:hypothetical protein
VVAFLTRTLSFVEAFVYVKKRITRLLHELRCFMFI